MSGVPDPFKQAESGRDFYKKHGGWAMAAVVMGSLLTLVAFLLGLGIWTGKLQFTPTPTLPPLPNPSQGPPTDIGSPEQHENKGKVLGDATFKWDAPERKSARLFDQKPDGSYCPKQSITFTSPELWQDRAVHVSFGHLKTKVMLHSGIAGEPPTFIVSLGNAKRIFRLHVAEKEAQRVGFEHFDSANPNGPLIREEPQDLDDPIPNNGILELEMHSRTKNGNTVEYVFDFTYVRPDGNRRTDTLTYEVQLDDPSPEETTTEIGTGTLKGRCFKFVS